MADKPAGSLVQLCSERERTIELLSSHYANDVLDIYELTRKYPKEERPELVSMMRKSAMSVPVSIGEGFMRRSPREKETAYKTSQEALEEFAYIPNLQ